MKKIVILLLITLFSILSNKTWSQTDSLQTEKPIPILLYAGLGGGMNTRGGNFDLSLTITSLGGTGGSFHYTPGIVALKNVPEDYYKGFLRTIPMHTFNAFSLNFVQKFSYPKGFFRLGFEAGPSWIKYKLVELKINPDWPDLFQYKYDKIYSIESTIGGFVAIKAEFPFLSFFGCDLSLFSILNDIQNVVGFDFCINLGLVNPNKIK